jgi:uncharacterized ParB-like nuclease family protein
MAVFQIGKGSRHDLCAMRLIGTRFFLAHGGCKALEEQDRGASSS